MQARAPCAGQANLGEERVDGFARLRAASGLDEHFDPQLTELDPGVALGLGLGLVQGVERLRVKLPIQELGRLQVFE